MVKASFADQSFLKGTRLVAVNSINWARIMARKIRLLRRRPAVGLAHARGIVRHPLGPVISSPVTWHATWACRSTSRSLLLNCNDILDRFMSGMMLGLDLDATLLLSMDIMVSSNFERLPSTCTVDGCGYFAGDHSFKQGAAVSASNRNAGPRPKLFDSAGRCTNLRNHRRSLRTDGRTADPHTAIGVKAARECRRNLGYSDGHPWARPTRSSSRTPWKKPV